MNPQTDTAPTLNTSGAGRHRDGDGFTGSYRTCTAASPEGGDRRHMRAWLRRWHPELFTEAPRVRFVWAGRERGAQR